MEQPNAELVDTRERYRALFDSIDDGFCIIEKVDGAGGDPLDFRYVDVNRAFAVQSGVADVVGRTIRQVVPGESEDWFHTYDAVLSTGVPIRFERRLESQGRVLEVFAFRVDDPNRPKVAALFRDITERTTLEAARHTAEVRYRRLFESAKDGILILDYGSGRIIDANPFMGELLSYPLEFFCGKELWEIGLFQDKSASEVAVRQLQTQGYVRYEHLPLESRDGRRVEVEIVGNAYHESGKRVMQCNIRDISERCRLERKAQDHADALADLNQRKDEFLAMLSHELRTPLAPIASAVQILRLQSDESQTQRQARQIIERQVSQLKHLIDDLLEVSRITTGKVRLRAAPIAVSSLVERAVEAVGPLVEWRRHVLEVQMPPTPIWLDADEARLEQVLVNLLTNAAKYTDDGGRIWLTVESDREQVVLRVRDSGVGIAPDLLPRIFDLFTQAERSLDRAQGGLGIGLCLARQLVELHGGTIEATSTVGRGSEFVVRLPVGRTLHPAPAASEPVESPPPCRVLVVDDSVDAAQCLAMLLTASGHDVRVAYDGHAALAQLEAGVSDLVLMDIGLPGIDGFEVAERIRQQPALGNVVLVALTGYGHEEDRRRSAAAGFNHHLVKPADFTELNKILASVASGLSS